MGKFFSSFSIRKMCLGALLLLPFVALSQNTDIELLKEINLNRNRSFDSILRTITHTAGPVAFITPLLILSLSYRKKTRNLGRKASYLIVAVLTAVLITTSLKYSINRPRPFVTYDFIEKMSSGGSPSFPSGHTTDAFVIATAMSLAFPQLSVVLPFFVWAVLVAYSRMALGVHYPVDVLVGILIGLAAAFGWYLVFRKKYLLKKP